MTAHSEFEDKIVTVARTFGWFAMGVRPAIRGRKGGWVTPWRHDGVGWPDLTLVHPERGSIVFAEVKIPPDTVTAEQQDWLARLANLVGCATWERDPNRSCVVAAAVWTPDDWSEIVDLLSAGQATTTP